MLLLLMAGAAWPQALEAKGRDYRAVISDHGELLSFRVGAGEMLAPGGCWLSGPRPLRFDSIQQVPGTLTASGPRASVTYHLAGDRLAIIVLNASAGEALRFHLPLAADHSRCEVKAERPPGVGSEGWFVECPPLARTRFELVPLPGPAMELPDGLGVEPRGSPVGCFNLPARPPFTDLDGRFLTIPLLLTNETDDDQRVACSGQLSGTDVLYCSPETVTVPRRDVARLDLRVPAPQPGVYDLRLLLQAAGHELEQYLRVAYAPDLWPAAASPSQPLAARRGLVCEPAPQSTPQLPRKWSTRRFVEGQRIAGLGLLPAPGAVQPMAPLWLLLGGDEQLLGNAADWAVPALQVGSAEDAAEAVRLFAPLTHGPRRLVISASELPAGAALLLQALRPSAVALWSPDTGAADWGDLPVLAGWVAEGKVRDRAGAGRHVDRRIYTGDPVTARELFRVSAARFLLAGS